MTTSPLSTCCFVLASCIGFAQNAHHLSAQPPKLLEVEFRGTRVTGMPVHWGRYDAAVLEPSGYLRLFDMSEVQHHRVLSIDFVPQALADARNQLQAELGGSYETLITGPYIIAAPVGAAARWRERFNALLAGYVRYFEVRGWPLRRPDFPLCVIVFANRQEFLHYFASQTASPPTNVVGSYFPRSNRCVLYQIESGGGTDWSETEATIVHEAVHQLAYNTGIHERLAENPIWFVEGLASMFEQANVYDLRAQQSTLGDRMIREKVDRLQTVWQNPAELQLLLQSLITSDQLFQQNPQLAYDLSWALTFYLAERMPNQYREYYRVVSQRPFGAYAAAERSRDFQRAFETDAGLLGIQMTRLFSN